MEILANKIYDEHIEKILKLTNKEPWTTRFTNFSEKIIEGLAEALDVETNKIKEIILDSEILQNAVSDITIQQFIDSYYDNMDDNIIKSYIEKFKYRLSRDAIEYLDQLRKQCFSIYKILESDKNGNILIQDIFLKTEPIKIEASYHIQSLKRGGHLYCKAIPFKNSFCLADTSFIIDNNDNFKRVKKYIAKNIKASLPDLIDYYINFNDKWIERKKLLDPVSLLLTLLPLVTLFEMEVLRLSYVEISYEIKNKDNVIKNLDSLAPLGIIPSCKFKWEFCGIPDGETEEEVLADIYIIDNKLICSTFEQDVLNNINKILKKKLGNNIGLGVINNKLDFD